MRVFLAGLTVFVLQWTVGEHLTVRGAAPDLLLCLAVSLAFAERRDRSVLLSCWFLGLLKDIGSGAPMGCFALLFYLTALLISWGTAFLFRDDALFQAAVVFVASLLCGIGCLLTLVVRLPLPPIEETIARLFLISLLSAVAMPPMALIFGRWVRSERVFRDGRTAMR